MGIEVIHEFSGRHESIYYGLEVSAQVYVADDDSVEVESWAVEGVQMPLSTLRGGLYDFLVAMAFEEREAGE